METDCSITPEMARVVASAADAARGGWSDDALAGIAAEAGALRADAEELARLLALGVADHGFREEVFETSPSFHASVFALAAGERIPLHDHPSLSVICKVLRGQLRVHSYEWVDSGALLARDCGVRVISAEDQALVFRGTPGTLHSIVAIESSAFLDLFAPYYDDVERPCTYYAVDEIVEQGGESLVRFRIVDWEEARR